MGKKLPRQFFQRDVLIVAPDMLGKYIVRKLDNGEIIRARITDVEAYRGEDDKASHAFKGRTKRTEVQYWDGGVVYVYLIYGIYWLINIVTGKKDQPQGVMIRAVEGIYGPGRVGKYLQLDKSLLGEPVDGEKVWIEDFGEKPGYRTSVRVGIDYAEESKDLEWRFLLKINAGKKISDTTLK